MQPCLSADVWRIARSPLSSRSPRNGSGVYSTGSVRSIYKVIWTSIVFVGGSQREAAARRKRGPAYSSARPPPVKNKLRAGVARFPRAIGASEVRKSGGKGCSEENQAPPLPAAYANQKTPLPNVGRSVSDGIRYIDYALLSSHKVTGPQLTSDTSIISPNRPVSTRKPFSRSNAL